MFQKSDEPAVLVYRLTATFPADERFELRSQIRRAATSTPTNIVEGCARETQRDYLRFLDIALGSANELAYLLHLAGRLSIMKPEEIEDCKKFALDVVRMLQKLITTLRHQDA
ncbi:MAG TPA: four helix bundle protein [Vicinamibacterales bacterium]|nr:four helix bundle protein [Vicinamibacterales bacterium]